MDTETEPKRYDPSNHLCVALKAAGADLIELCGQLWGYESATKRVPNYIIKDMQDAVDKAAAALRSYQEAAANGERLTNVEFRRLGQLPSAQRTE